MKINLLFSFLVIGLTTYAQPLILTPSISPDGSTIAFSYQGDIWTVP
ncbi:MAG TPA: hypothetical protein DHN29_03460, partial [Cytophagales bacterium]|nr:hypothetical protein [Cytophagales bacterium]